MYLYEEIIMYLYEEITMYLSYSAELIFSSMISISLGTP